VRALERYLFRRGSIEDLDGSVRPIDALDPDAAVIIGLH